MKEQWAPMDVYMVSFTSRVPSRLLITKSPPDVDEVTDCKVFIDSGQGIDHAVLNCFGAFRFSNIDYIN